MQRRKFLQSIAWWVGGLVVAPLLPLKGFATSLVTVRGTVRANGKPLKNVVVSDGYSVVQTDAKGRYQISLHQDAIAVFVSTPAGYAFPQKNGMAKHYHLLNQIKNKKEVNFDLESLKVNDELHQFVIWADTQIQNESDARKLKEQTLPDIRQVISAAGAGTLMHGITVGDIIWDRFPLFDDYDEVVKATGIPFFQCLGNHDMDYNKGGDDASDDTFQLRYGPTYYSFNRGKAHYVVMDDVRYLGKDKQYDGYLQQHQLDWLEKDLALVPQDHLIIICVHIPIHNGVKNNEDFYKIVERFPHVHVMSGHTHYNRNVIKNQVYEHNHGTVCGAWWTGAVCGDGTPGGYAVYTVKGNELEWYYKSTGKPLEYQMRLYTEKNISGEQELLVNVWNADPAWKVEYSIDDSNYQSLEQTRGFDPLANELYLGPELPSPRQWVEPSNTDHLFKAVLPADAGKVYVKVTDRFGRVFRETKQI